MRMRIWMKSFLLVPALCLAGLPAAARPQDASQQQTGDPVADAAKKARESKKDTPAPDSATTPTPGTAATATQAAGDATKAGNAAKTGDAPKTEDPNSEAAWRKRFQAQHDRIAKAEKELDILGRELEKAQLEYYPDPQKAMKEQNGRTEINDKTAKIDAKKKEIAQLKQGLDDLEDQLRKANGNPGWAR